MTSLRLVFIPIALDALASLNTLDLSAGLNTLDLSASLNTLDLFAGLNTLDLSASLNTLDLFAGLNTLDLSASLNTLDLFAGLNTLDLSASLNTLDLFASLNTLDLSASLNTLDALVGLDPLDAFARLDSLDTFAAEIAVLFLKFRVLELHTAVMSRVEFPVLELSATTDVHFVEFAVERGVRLDRCKSTVSPIIVVPQRWPHEERRTKPERRPDRPPRRIPEEWHVCRWPVVDTVDDHRIIDRNVNVVGFDRFDHDVFRRPHIACARRRGDPSDALLVARLQIAGSVCPGAQCLNRILNVVGLS